MYYARSTHCGVRRATLRRGRVGRVSVAYVTATRLCRRALCRRAVPGPVAPHMALIRQLFGHAFARVHLHVHI